MSLNFFFPENSPAADVDSPHCPRQQRDYFLEKKSSDSYLDTLKSSDFYMRKEKLRLISGTFDKVQTFL